MKSLFFLLLLITIIVFSICQNYCNLFDYCNNCSYCGITSYRCNCSFYNGYCLSENSNQLLYSRDFITNYDGCYRNEGDLLQICGETYIYIKNGESKSLNFNSTNKFNFFCYYKVINQDSLNLTLKIQKKGNLSPDFNLFLLIYDDFKGVKNEVSNVLVADNYFEINEDNCRELSIYLEFENPQNIEGLSLTFSNIRDSQEFIDTETTQVIASPSSSKNMGLIIGIIIGGVAFITVIIITIILLKKKSENEITIINWNNNAEKDVKRKEKAKNFLDKLKINIYDKESNKDCPKCILCQRDFIPNNLIIITECSHIFHEKCFHNYILTYLSLNCPNCKKDLISNSENDMNKRNLPMLNTLNEYIPEQTIQTNQNNSMSGMNIIK